jgi:hypothetical protein
MQSMIKKIITLGTLLIFFSPLKTMESSLPKECSLPTESRFLMESSFKFKPSQFKDTVEFNLNSINYALQYKNPLTIDLNNEESITISSNNQDILYNSFVSNYLKNQGENPGENPIKFSYYSQNKSYPLLELIIMNDGFFIHSVHKSVLPLNNDKKNDLKEFLRYFYKKEYTGDSDLFSDKYNQEMILFHTIDKENLAKFWKIIAIEMVKLKQKQIQKIREIEISMIKHKINEHRIQEFKPTIKILKSYQNIRVESIFNPTGLSLVIYSEKKIKKEIKEKTKLNIGYVYSLNPYDIKPSLTMEITDNSMSIKNNFETQDERDEIYNELSISPTIIQLLNNFNSGSIKWDDLLLRHVEIISLFLMENFKSDEIQDIINENLFLQDKKNHIPIELEKISWVNSNIIEDYIEQ